MAGSQEALYVVFDGGPGPIAGRFVDVETADGANPVGGSGLDWTEQHGRWLLGPLLPPAALKLAARLMTNAIDDTYPTSMFDWQEVARFRDLLDLCGAEIPRTDTSFDEDFPIGCTR